MLTIWPLLLAYFVTHRPGAALLATLLGSIPVLLWLRSLGLDLTPTLFVVTFFGARDLQALLLCGLSIELVFSLALGVQSTVWWRWWPAWWRPAARFGGCTLRSTRRRVGNMSHRWLSAQGWQALLAASTGALFNRLWPE